MLGVCFSAYAYGAKSDPARILLSTVYFKKDSAVPAPEFENKLKKVQATLKAHPAIGLEIEGYAYNQGTPAKNRQIAQKRAEAVQQWFVKHGVDAGRLVVKNLGGTEQAIRQDSPKNSTLAERVEIVKIVLKLPVAYLPVSRYEFAPVLEGREVTHHFVIQNKGDALLKVQKVKTDWGCTAVSYTRQIPPGGEGKITLKVKTKGYGGRKLSKGATVYTNDKKKSALRLSIAGNIEKFVTIRPRQVRLRGPAGEQLKRKVTIIPVEKYPFKILKVRAQNGENIRFELQEENALIVENQRLQKGRYFDNITLETDSKIRPTLNVRVYGDIRPRPEKEKKESQ